MKKPTETQIEALRDRAEDHQREKGTKYPGMSYEDGIIAAINFVLGDDDEIEDPMD